MNKQIREKLEAIYGGKKAEDTSRRLQGLLGKWRRKIPQNVKTPTNGVPASQSDVVLISYGDNIQSPGQTPLNVLREFAAAYLSEAISGIHILPFSPYSSDDGFSVMDYRQVNADWGSWDDVTSIASSFRLMADLVLNHCSAEGTWFRAFLEGDSRYSDYFIAVEPGTDLSAVFRPRALPLTHEFDVNGGRKHLWTTFSRDQVDLNFASPDVFLEFVDILLDYVSKGVQMVRLDAVGFLWKEIGTSCMHHAKTHQMVKLFRLILNDMAPQVILITETNVPHKENISYFGGGSDEAHMVYQFTLPPLTLDAFIRGDASRLTEWAATLPPPNPDHTFFNFLASHDGIGLLPCRNYLSEQEFAALVAAAKERGALISYKSTPDGEIPYELNVSYRDVVAEDSLPTERRAAKFLASQAVMLAMAGVPGIYIHSLLGSGNWKDGVSITGANRTINREKLLRAELEAALNDTGDIRHMIFEGYRKMLIVRRAHAAFHPAAAQQIMDMGPSLFALIRTSEERQSVLCLQSVSGTAQHAALPSSFAAAGLRDLITGRQVPVKDGKVALEGWEVLWLVAE